jgi:glycosyltransferase involved in cell wall biosynthesis
MKRLLLVSYYFPPHAGPGVFRPLRLSKYLPEYGWEVNVLAVSDRARLLRDETLVSDIPEGVRVERTASLEPRTLLLALHRLGLGSLARRIEPFFFLPDDQRGWVPFASRRAVRLLRQREHQAVLTTSAPYSAHLVGLRLRDETGIPWVADFRDEWTTNPYIRYPTGWHRRLNERLERAVLTCADRVVCVSRPWLDALRGRVPGRRENRFRVIPNGYDGAHFPDEPPPLPERFRVVYTGTFYGHRSPRVFLEGLRLALDEGRVPRDEIEVHFVGHTAHADWSVPLPEPVRVVEQRPYFDAVRELADAAVLLLVVPPEGGAGNHTGKLFPYLASGRPILALAPEPNVAADLIRRSGSGVVVPPDDPAAVRDALAVLYARWKKGVLVQERDRGLIEKYEASTQAAAYARLLDEL